MGKEVYSRAQGESQTFRRFSRDIVETLRIHGLRIRKSDNLFLLDRLARDPLIVTMTLCPLYAVSSLSESRLIKTPDTIEQSRVVEKWRVGTRVFKAIAEACSKKGIGTEAVLTFADVGVITKESSEEDVSLLAYHERLYRDAAERDLRGVLGIQYSFQRYSDIHPEFPQFIRATSARSARIHMEQGISTRALLRENTGLRSEVAELMNRLHQKGMVFDPSIYDKQTGYLSGRTEEFVVSLMRQLGSGFDLTEGLMRQYGTFDAHTTLPGELNIFIEREPAALLLQLTDIFPHRQNPRVDIIC